MQVQYDEDTIFRALAKKTELPWKPMKNPTYGQKDDGQQIVFPSLTYILRDGAISISIDKVDDPDDGIYYCWNVWLEWVQEAHFLPADGPVFAIIAGPGLLEALWEAVDTEMGTDWDSLPLDCNPLE